MAGYLKRETPGWGVLGDAGEWLAYHVDETAARRVYARDPSACALVRDLYSDEIAGEEHYTVVEVKPAICVVCGSATPQRWQDGLELPEDWDCDERGIVCPAHRKV